MRFAKLGHIHTIGGVVPVLVPLALFGSFLAAMVVWPFVVALVSFWALWPACFAAALLWVRRLVRPRLRGRAIRSWGQRVYEG